MIEADALARLARAYPDTPAILDHDLAGHAMTSLPALMVLAGSLDADLVDISGAEISAGRDDAPPAPLTAVHTLRHLSRSVFLRDVRRAPSWSAWTSEMQGFLTPLLGGIDGLPDFAAPEVWAHAPHLTVDLPAGDRHRLVFQLRGGTALDIFPPSGFGEMDAGWFSAPLTLTDREVLFLPPGFGALMLNGQEAAFQLILSWETEDTRITADARALRRSLGQRGGVSPKGTLRRRIEAGLYRTIRALRD